MNNSTYKVWMILLNNPRKWMDVSEIAYLTNLTRRQASTILLINLSSPLIEKEHITDKDPVLQVRLNGTDNDLAQLRRQITTECYNITEEKKQAVWGCLSIAGWTTVSDIAFDTGMKRLEVARVLMVSDNVISKETSSGTFYRRDN